MKFSQSSGNQSYMTCMIRTIVDCFEERAKAPNSGCECIPNNTFKSYFEIHPSSLDWDECKTNSEYAACFRIMDECSYDVVTKCQASCGKVEYRGHLFRENGMQSKDNEVRLWVSFNTMETEIKTEVELCDVATFIGTAGGSLGLFIGFSFTGFADQILDFFIRN